MRAGRVEEAGALAAQISEDITRRNKTRLSRMNGSIVLIGLEAGGLY